MRRVALAVLLLAASEGAACRRRPAAVRPAPGAEERAVAGGETDAAREAREKRATAVAGFPVQPAVAAEACPVLLAPDFGAPTSGALEEGAPVDVVLVEPGFYGIRLPKTGLAFVPVRCVRLLPGPFETPAVSRPRREIVPEVRSLEGGPGTSPVLPSPLPGAAPPTPSAVVIPAGAIPKASPPPSHIPFASLPAGSEPPVLMSRAEPAYPEAARRMRLAGEVVLHVVVQADGRVGVIEVVSGAPAGMTEAAEEAVRKWVYRPARVDGQPVAAWKEVRVRFALEPGR